MCGMVKFWGLTINALSVINLVMAVGLVVDYSAHIVHVYFKEGVGAEVVGNATHGDS